MNTVKGKKKATSSTGFAQQLSLFSKDSLVELTKAVSVQLTSAVALAASGLLDAIPTLKNLFQIKADTVLEPKTERLKLEANVAAIRLAKKIELENRTAALDEKKVLVQFSGWGSLAAIWSNDLYAECLQAESLNSEELSFAAQKWKKTYFSARQELENLLSVEEIQAAGQSTLNAYFTRRVVISSIWKAIVNFGFGGGTIVEPAAGAGHFIGLMPIALRERSKCILVEKETLSGLLVSQQYPEAETHVCGFEDVTLADSSVDLIIGNVPFGDYKVYDSNNRDLSGYHIHNYFICRSARALRPGGLMALITTAGTFDSASRKVRQQLQLEGMELVGAVRLPSCTFEENAGTEVTTDILFMRKKVGNTAYFASNSFIGTTTIRTIEAENPETDLIKQIRINEYFAERPKMMIGEMFLAEEVGKGGLYRGDSQTLFLADKGDFEQKLDTVIESLPKLFWEDTPRQGLNHFARKAVDRFAEFSGHVKFGNRVHSQVLVIKEYEALKDSFEKLLKAEISGQPDEITDPLRFDLNARYNLFVKAFGPLNKNRKIAFLESFDPEFLRVQSLEFAETNLAGKLVYIKSAILTERVYPLGTLDKVVTTLEDAVRVSLYKFGQVNVEYISQTLGRNSVEVEAGLIQSGLVFIDPINGSLIEKNSYLSGDLRDKLAVAKSLIHERPELQANVNALELAIPPSIPLALINFQLGSVWLPVQVIADWIESELSMKVKLYYNPNSCEYELDLNGTSSVKNTSLGSRERKATDLIESALNGRSVVVMKTISTADGDKQVKDVEATSQAIQCQEALQELFIDWCRANAPEAIETAFNERFNGYVIKSYEKPAVAHYPGANESIFMRAHQFRGVERIKDQDTMLAHVVGSGKTFTMISAAMEMIRLGRLSKVVIAVQNSTVDDFGAAWRKLYPSALIYVPEKADLEEKNRKRFLQRIATNRFDGIVLPQSFLKLIPDDPTAEEELIREELSRIEAQIKACERLGRGAKKQVKALNKEALRIEAKRKAQKDRVKDNVLHFGQLGVDGLFLDEAHKYKRYGFYTHRRNIKGIDTQGSQDAFQAMAKCRTIQRKGGRVVLATGTPISNTMAEAWTMLRFIAAYRLDSLQLSTFDQFAGTFGKVIPSFELTTGGQFKAVERFAKFVNVQQLSELYRSHVDVVLNEDVEEFKKDGTLPILADQTEELEDGSFRTAPGFTRILLPQTEGVQRELEAIREELKWFEKLTGEKKKENSHIPLVAFGKAKKATLDIRLLSASNPDEEGSKTNRAVAEILHYYKLSDAYKGTQLVFSDMYQSPTVADLYLDDEEQFINPDFGKKRFNLFEDIQAKLIAFGIPANEIAIVPQEAKKREPIFKKVRTGEIRVMLGSSERMGVGVNAQERLVALHHLDAPARPTDFEQRNGRIIRQGNLHALWKKVVHILTYGVEKTLDATAYGRLAIKQKFINQVLKGVGLDNTMSDVSGEDDFASMSFDQMMATLSGSQFALLYTTKNHELTRLVQQKKNFERSLIDAQQMVERARQSTARLTANLPQLDMETEMLNRHFPDGGIHKIEFAGMEFTEKWGNALEDYFSRLKARAKRGADAAGTIRINGVTIGVKGAFFDGEGKDSYGIIYSWGKVIYGEVNHAIGFAASLRWNISRAKEYADNAREQIAHNLKVETEFTPRLTATFKHEKELLHLKSVVADLKAQLEAESAESETKSIGDSQPNVAMAA